MQVSTAPVPLPGAAGGGLGQAVDKRPLPGAADKAIVTYKPIQPKFGPATPDAGYGPRLPGDTVTMVQQVPPGEPGAEADLPGMLDHDEKETVRRLEARDAAVRAEESAHKAMGGAFAGPIHYDYTRGPDGRLYATGGHVSMTTAGVANRHQMEQALGAFAAAGRVPSATSAADFLAGQSALRGLAEIDRADASDARASAAPRLDLRV